MEHEVERHARVGKDHALDRRVADVALVPERLVLEGCGRIAADHAREAGDVLEPPRVALVRHRRRALLARAELLLHLAHLRAREVTQLDGDLLARRCDQRERADERRVAVALHHLRGGGLETDAEPRAHRLFDRGRQVGERADRAGDLAH